MHTDADTHLDAARLKIREAIHELSAIVVAECSGTDDYRETFRHRLKEAMSLLIDIRANLET